MCGLRRGWGLQAGLSALKTPQSYQGGCNREDPLHLKVRAGRCGWGGRACGACTRACVHQVHGGLGCRLFKTACLSGGACALAHAPRPLVFARCLCATVCRLQARPVWTVPIFLRDAAVADVHLIFVFAGAQAFQDLAQGLPWSKHVHSKLVCALTREIMNEHNPPMVLPNGAVYSQKAIQQLASAKGVFMCPNTGVHLATSHVEADECAEMTDDALPASVGPRLACDGA